jgi:hypothetical protein
MHETISDATGSAARHPLYQRLAAGTFMILLLMTAGCNATTTAQDFANVIAGILNIAKAEIPALPPTDAAIITQWTTLGTTLDAQLQTCIRGGREEGRVSRVLQHVRGGDREPG